MSPWLGFVIAAGAAAGLFLWFRNARRVMDTRRATVDGAAEQLAACRKKAQGVRYDPDLAKVLLRCESIYLQSVRLYHQSLGTAWIRLPAFLMGFRPIPEETYFEIGQSPPES